MKCDMDGSFYLGSEVPSCNKVKKLNCFNVDVEASCCEVKFEKSCCPQTMDESCASSTKSFLFDFETLITFFNLYFKDLSRPIYDFVFSKHVLFSEHSLDVFIIPKTNLLKPELVQLQSFLL
jgi:hypothetical protein